MEIGYKEWDKIAHTLGINLYNAIHSTSHEDKYLPSEFYRNHYNYGQANDEREDPEFIKNIEPYIKKWTQYDLKYFCINDEGISAFRKYFKQEVTDKFVPLPKRKQNSKQRYSDYLHVADCYESFKHYLQTHKQNQ